MIRITFVRKSIEKKFRCLNLNFSVADLEFVEWHENNVVNLVFNWNNNNKKSRDFYESSSILPGNIDVMG